MEIIDRLRRMSVVQLRALAILAGDKNGMAGSSGVGKQIDVSGKSLGGVFSSLARQRVGGVPLVIPWGRDGRGLRWRLNPAVGERALVAREVKELLRYE